MRSVSNGPGSKPLMVTLRLATFGCRSRPATKPVNPERAPLDKPSVSIRGLDGADVDVDDAAKPRSHMPSITAFMAQSASACWRPP